MRLGRIARNRRRPAAAHVALVAGSLFLAPLAAVVPAAAVPPASGETATGSAAPAAPTEPAAAGTDPRASLRVNPQANNRTRTRSKSPAPGSTDTPTWGTDAPLPAGTTQGTLLDEATAASGATPVSWASTNGKVYVAVALPHRLIDAACRLAIVDVDDGSVLRTMDAACSGTHLSATALVMRGPGDAPSWSFTDVLTGAPLGSWTLPTDSTVYGIDPAWVLFSPPAAEKAATSVVLQRRGVPDLVVLRGELPQRALRVDADTVLLLGPTRAEYVNGTTGAMVPLPLVPPVSGASVVHGRTALFWLANGSRELHWLPRGATEQLTVELPATGSLQALGDSVALVQEEPDEEGAWRVRGINLADGSLNAAQARHMLGLAALDPGRLVGQVRSSDGTKIMVMERAKPPRLLYSAPLWNPRRSRVALSGDRVVVDAALDSGRVPFSTTIGAGGGWGALQESPGVLVQGTIEDAVADLTVTHVRGSDGRLVERVTWPGGHLDRPADLDRSYLKAFPGGALVYQDLLAGVPHAVREVMAAREGRRLAVIDPASRPHAVDRWRLWQLAGDGPSADGSRVTVTDLSGALPVTREVRTGLTCSRVLALSASGRWLLVTCDPQDGTTRPRSWLVDTLGVVPTWLVPLEADTTGESAVTGMLAAGSLFVVRWASNIPYLAITDAVSHQVRLVGGFAGTDPRTGMLDVDPTTRRVAYLDADYRTRWFTLPQAAVAPTGTPDTTPPTASLAGPPGDAFAAASLPLTWSAVDPRGGAGVLVSLVDTYDVRYRRALAGGELDDYVYPLGLQGTTATSGSISAPPGSRTCVQVRGRDGSGNVGEWSAESCWTVDVSAPTIRAAGVGPAVLASVVTSPVTFSWDGRDDVRVAGYGVQLRTAAPGAGLGAWTGVTLRDPLATSAVASVAPGGQVCFRVYAKDGLGHTSSWSPPACASLPWDDRSLAAMKGPLVRGTTAMALAQTVTVLNGQGAELDSGAVTGSQVALVVLRGKGQGAVDVYAGTTRLGRVSLAATSWRRDVVLLPARAMSKAVVRVVSVSTLPARIDALAIVR